MFIGQRKNSILELTFLASELTSRSMFGRQSMRSKVISCRTLPLSLDCCFERPSSRNSSETARSTLQLSNVTRLVLSAGVRSANMSELSDVHNALQSARTASLQPDQPVNTVLSVYHYVTSTSTHAYDTNKIITPTKYPRKILSISWFGEKVKPRWTHFALYLILIE